MPPMYSSADLTGAATVIRTLLDPLAHETPEAWRRTVALQARRLFHADHAYVQLAGRRPLYVGDGIEPATFAALADALAEASADAFRYRDAEMDRLYRRARGRLDGVFTRERNDAAMGRPVAGTTIYEEVCVPAGMVHFQGLVGRSPLGDAMLWVSRASPHERIGEAAVPLLELLEPAFRAGLDTLAAALAYRAELEALSAPVLVRDAAGEAWINPALRALAAGSAAGGDFLDTLLDAAAARARRLLASDRSGPAEVAGAIAPFAVVHAGRRFRVLPRLLPPGAFSGRRALVLRLDDASVALPDAAALRSRFGLTAREAEVALRLAHGRSEKAIARDLGISRYTARRHTERVFEKLGIRSRARVALALLQADE